jgi:hypothetical protein
VHPRHREDTPEGDDKRSKGPEDKELRQLIEHAVVPLDAASENRTAIDTSVDSVSVACESLLNTT